LARSAIPPRSQTFGTVAILAGSVGTAMALPTSNALKQAGNHVVFIEGARNTEMVVFEDEVRQASNETYIMTDDGSYGEQGLVTKKLNDLIAAGRKIDFILAVGPVPMMRAVAQVTAPLGIKTMVSLNSIHGGRNRHVRRLPRAGGIMAPSSPAWMAGV